MGMFSLATETNIDVLSFQPVIATWLFLIINRAPGCYRAFDSVLRVSCYVLVQCPWVLLVRILLLFRRSEGKHNV